MFQKLESKQHSWRNTCIAWKHYKIGSSVSESVPLLISLHPYLFDSEPLHFFAGTSPTTLSMDLSLKP